MRVFKETEGNGAIAILLPEDRNCRFDRLQESIFNALVHFGIPFRVFTKDQLEAKWDEVSRLPLIFVPQSGVMASLSASLSDKVFSAVSDDGLGLLCYENNSDGFPSQFLENCTVGNLRPTFSSLITKSNGHFITWLRDNGEVVKSDLGIQCFGISENGKEAILENEYGDSLVLCKKIGKGRLTVFPFSSDLFCMDAVGHACGADDLFTRSIIWTARKPFFTWSMPHYAGLMVDDCSGSINHFRYIDMMNNAGWLPTIQIFTATIDEVSHEDTNMGKHFLQRKCSGGEAEVNFHGIRYNESFCFNHPEGRPLSEKDLRLNFALWDYYEKALGVKNTCWAHPHFGEITSGALKYYIDRGIQFITYLLPLDAAWFDVPGKFAPIPPMKPFGHAGFFMQEDESHPGLWLCDCVLDRKNRKSTEYVSNTDYLWGHTPFWDESPEPLLEESIQLLVKQVRRGIDSGFYGNGGTHEERIATLRDSELNYLYTEAAKRLSRYNLCNKKLSQCLQIEKKHCSTLIKSLSFEENGSLRISMSSSEAIGTEGQIWNEGMDSIPVIISAQNGII